MSTPKVKEIEGVSPKEEYLFQEQAPNALDPSYKFLASDVDNTHYNIVVQQSVHQTGLTDDQGNKLGTPIWGYGSKNTKNSADITWPGKTFEVYSQHKITVTWFNELIDESGQALPHLLPIDTSIHWCYKRDDTSLSIANDGVPLVPHLHGGHTDSGFDGYPEYFVGRTENSRGRDQDQDRGPSEDGCPWADTYTYDNSQNAGTLWYHDHAIGITRLNVYAGLAGFYIIRDNNDTGKHDNPLALPAEQYELAYCVQDRRFKETGELFFPAYEGELGWDDFITCKDATPPENEPSILAEFFGNHMLVNGKLWPKAAVEPRHYRLRFLNGCDSRFMRLHFRSVAADAISFDKNDPFLSFDVIGSDQGFLEKTATVTEVDFMPGERIDIVFNFANVPEGSRVIVQNILGDDPFSGSVIGNDSVSSNDRYTDRIMAFDVISGYSSKVTDNYEQQSEQRAQLIEATYLEIKPVEQEVRTRKLGLFEGKDEYGRLMPMLGTAEYSTDAAPQGSMIWTNDITENPMEGDTEIWEIYNTTEDAHPIHVHLVHFQILSRENFRSSFVKAKNMISDAQAKDMTSAVQAKEMSSAKKIIGKGFEFVEVDPILPTDVLETEKGPKDMVICYPNQITRIKMTFDKTGRYVWHCHILSHEDHDMMRPFKVHPRT